MHGGDMEDPTMEYEMAKRGCASRYAIHGPYLRTIMHKWRISEWVTPNADTGVIALQSTV